MSHVNFDFLADSILFGFDLETDFQSVDENALRLELRNYREYVLGHFDEIKKETVSDNKNITVTIESFGNRPDDEILKQLALYIDCVLIADPLFSLTEEKSPMSNICGEYMGMQSENVIDKQKLSEALRYMKKLTDLVVCDYVKFVPLSILHEAPKEIPIRFDKNNFSDCLPKNIMTFLREHIEVYNIVKESAGLRVCLEEPLKKGTGLYLAFSEYPEHLGEIVQYTNMRYPWKKMGA